MIETQAFGGSKVAEDVDVWGVESRKQGISKQFLFFFSMIIVSYWVSYGNGGPIIGVPINSTKSYWLKHHSTQKKTVQLLSQNGQGQALLAGNSGSALLEAWCQYAQRTVEWPTPHDGCILGLSVWMMNIHRNQPW